jgi:hemolysin activation/secretion protein
MGGSRELRGYRKNRFWGKSFFYSSNELQYIFNVRSQVFNGKAGIVSFYDLGRIWQPGENSNRWHDGYGGGIIISPFNKIMVSVTYGISTENKLVHLKFGVSL